MNRRVVITGMASISPLGVSLTEILNGLREGLSTADILDLFPSENFPCRVVAQVDSSFIKKFNNIPDIDTFGFDRKTLIGIIAVIEALKDTNFNGFRVHQREVGISLGIGINNIDFDKLLCYFNLKKESKLKEFYTDILNGSCLTQISCDYISHWLSKNYGFRGPILNNLSACSASTQAIGTAYKWIKREKAKIVITGGVDSILNPIGILGFSILGTLTSRNNEPKIASRPFDRNRDGFVPGEGAGILVLEELEHALSRGAKIYGEICGYGSSMDAYKMTAPCENGYGAALAMKKAIRDAAWEEEEVQYINAHGTSTYLNDVTETRAIKEVFKDRAYNIPVSSIKSQIGHLIAASGAVEIIMCLIAMNNGFIPATINLEYPDIECDLDYVAKSPRKLKVDKFLKNSFALGGQNTTLAIGRYKR